VLYELPFEDIWKLLGYIKQKSPTTKIEAVGAFTEQTIKGLF